MNPKLRSLINAGLMFIFYCNMYSVLMLTTSEPRQCRHLQGCWLCNPVYLGDSHGNGPAAHGSKNCGNTYFLRVRYLILLSIISEKTAEENGRC